MVKGYGGLPCRVATGLGAKAEKARRLSFSTAAPLVMKRN
jgi:hypothetical protein